MAHVRLLFFRRGSDVFRIPRLYSSRPTFRDGEGTVNRGDFRKTKWPGRVDSPPGHRLNILSLTPSEGEAPPFGILDWPTGGNEERFRVVRPRGGRMVSLPEGGPTFGVDRDHQALRTGRGRPETRETSLGPGRIRGKRFPERESTGQERAGESRRASARNSPKETEILSVNRKIWTVSVSGSTIPYSGTSNLS